MLHRRGKPARQKYERKYSALPAPCDRVEAAVVAAFAVTVAELRSPMRGTLTCALARQTAVYLAHVSLGVSPGEVAAAFGRHRSTIAHACRLIEDRRDDPAFDDRIAALEKQCQKQAQERAVSE